MLTKYRKWAGQPLYSKAKGPSIYNWTKGGPLVCNAANGRKVAHHYVEKLISGI